MATERSSERRLLGADIARKQQWIIRTGDVVYNKLFAWKGSFAIAGAIVDGHIVSDKFPTYAVNEDLVDPRYLKYYFQTPELATQAELLSKGAAAISKLTLNPPQFWDLTISAPALSEQQGIVALLDGHRERIEKAIASREVSRAATRALGAALLSDSTDGGHVVPLGQVLRLRKTNVVVEPDVRYDFAGVLSFGRGVFRGPSKMGSEFSYKVLTRLDKGNFVYPKLMAWEGAFGIALPEYEGLVVSPEFPVFELNEDVILPETLQVYFGQEEVWQAVSGTSRGTNVRRRRLHPKVFLDHAIAIPPMPVQVKLRELVRSTRRILELQDDVSHKLEALMPSLINEVFTSEAS
jgi:type I restriction enzyme S subunit